MLKRSGTIAFGHKVCTCGTHDIDCWNIFQIDFKAYYLETNGDWLKKTNLASFLSVDYLQNCKKSSALKILSCLHRLRNYNNQGMILTLRNEKVNYECT